MYCAESYIAIPCTMYSHVKWMELVDRNNIILTSKAATTYKWEMISIRIVSYFHFNSQLAAI